MAELVYMDVPKVRGMASTFGTIGDVLRGVAKAIEVLSVILKASAFVGAVGLAVVAQYLDALKPHIENIAEKCTELSKDLSASVDAYVRGDATGAARFH